MLVDRPLAGRLERAIAARAAGYARARCDLGLSRQCDVTPFAGGTLVCADGDPPAPVNRAIGLGLAGSVLLAELDAVEMFYRSRGALPRLDICALADPSLIELAGRRGYRLERFQNALACPLPHAPARLAGDDVVVTMANAADADIWSRTVTQGFGGVDEPSQTDLDMNRPNFHCRNGISYLAWLDGQPAGGGAMFMHEGVVELGGASTRAQYRRRGVQSALLRRRLADAGAAGCDIAIVITAPGSDSQRNIERLGFQLAYARAILVNL